MGKKTQNRAPAQGDRYAPRQWGAMAAASELEELTVPSGQLVLVRRPGVPGLQAAGVLTSVDSLTAKVASYVTGDRVTVEDARRMAQDPEACAEMTNVIDRVVQHIVVKPQLHRTPSDPTRREVGKIYLDTVDMGDRVFLFNFAVAGLRDVERFRRAAGAAVDAVATEQGLGDATGGPALDYGSVDGVLPEPGGVPVRKPARARPARSRAGGAQRKPGADAAGADVGALAG